MTRHAAEHATQRRSASITPRTHDWDDTDDALKQLHEQNLLDTDGPNFLPSRDVRYSLGLGE